MVGGGIPAGSQRSVTARVPHPGLYEGQLRGPPTAVVLEAKPALQSSEPPQDSSPTPAGSPVPEPVRHRCGISSNCPRLDVHSRSPRDPRYLQQTRTGQPAPIPGLGGGRWSPDPGVTGTEGTKPHSGLAAPPREERWGGSRGNSHPGSPQGRRGENPAARSVP